jgi:hypothetical protein
MTDSLWRLSQLDRNDVNVVIVSATITTVIFIGAAFWVPVDLHMIGGYFATDNYYNANIFNQLAPRALLGTVAKALHLNFTGFVVLRECFQALWLFLIVVQIVRALNSDQKGQFVIESFALSFLFGFNTVVFTTNGYSLFIDVVPYCLVLIAIPLLLPVKRHVTVIHLIFANLLLFSAVMVHEKTGFDLAILTVFASWKYGIKRGVARLLPSIMGSLFFLLIVRTEHTFGRTPIESAEHIRSGLTFLMRESLNVWGIVLAGGILWVIYFISARYFVKVNSDDKTRRSTTVIFMTALCFAPLLMAHDTIRDVGLIWLPTYLLIREIDLKSMLKSIHFRDWAIGACCLQLLLPPMLLYMGGVTPYNCYSRELIARFLPREKDLPRTPTSHKGLQPDVGPFGLYALAREDISSEIVCWPPRPIRLPAAK